jgi:hypothetical protein
MNVFLLILIPVRYLQLFFRVLIKVPTKPKNIVYMLAWIVGGPFLLLKLYVLDVATMCRIMLDLGAEGEDLLSTELEPKALDNTIRTFKKIVRAGLYHQEFFEKEKETVKKFQVATSESKARISDLMQIMGLSKSHKKIMNTVAKNVISGQEIAGKSHDSSEESDQESENSRDNEDVGVSFSSKYSAIYSQPQEILVKLMLKKFAMQNSQSEEVDDLKVDINFMLKTVKHNVNLENVHRLIGFDKTTLVKASKLIRKSGEANIMTEIGVVKDRVVKLESRIENVIHDLTEVKDQQVRVYELLLQKLSK